MTDYKKIIEENQHRIVGVRRYWNNSMHLYSDSIVVWDFDKKDIEVIQLGADILDAIKVKIDENGEAFKAYGEQLRNNRESLRRSIAKDSLLQYVHHGLITANKIVRFLNSLSDYNRVPLSRLLKTKKFRNKFRQNICEQVLTWIRKRPKDRKFNFPLSPKQLDCIR
jgi:hypothetical protein